MGSGARRANEWRALFGFMTVCYLVAGVAGSLTAPEIGGWYAALAKPRFNPPDGVFGPVWTVLYGLMAWAAWLVWREADSRERRVGLALFWVQLGLNFGWTVLFFRMHRVGIAGVEIVALWLAILAATVYFARVRRAAGWMMGPYLAWVGFASVLNWAIVKLSY